MTTRKDAALAKIAPYIERARVFSGWTFSGVRMRRLGPLPPWDYEAVARRHASDANSVLDLGTGGGEVFARIGAALAARLVASEEWDVNAAVARDRLAPAGVGVVRASSLSLPFRDAGFDLVLDRHEALDPADVARAVTPGGMVITQQCGPDDWPELRRFFPRKSEFGDHYHEYQRGFESAGLRIDDARWHEAPVAFASLGDLAFMLLVAPWTIPGFDPIAEIDALLALEDALGTSDGIVLTEIRYLIVARKPL